MTDRKPIMCGGAELRWNAVRNRYYYEGPIIHVNIEGWNGLMVWAGRVERVSGDYRACFFRTVSHDTPELAAADLAKFLGEMAEALEPWRVGR